MTVKSITERPSQVEKKLLAEIFWKIHCHFVSIGKCQNSVLCKFLNYNHTQILGFPALSRTKLIFQDFPGLWKFSKQIPGLFRRHGNSDTCSNHKRNDIGRCDAWNTVQRTSWRDNVMTRTTLTMVEMTKLFKTADYNLTNTNLWLTISEQTRVNYNIKICQYKS